MSLMYNRWYLLYLIAGAIIMLFSIWYVCKHWRAKPERRTLSVVLAVLTCLVVAVFAALLPQTLRGRELSHYDRLFHAERIECDGADVTELFRQHAGECWTYTQMEDYKLEKDAGTTVGALRFYNENQRAFQKINVVRLSGAADNPRVYQFGGGYYVFSSADWENKDYVYGFSEELAQQLLDALPE